MNDSIPICRSVFKHWIYADAEYLKVWLTMLGRARYMQEPKTDVYEKILYTLNYGEFIFGRMAWSKKTGISEQRLRHLVKLLIKDQMIQLISQSSKFTIYKIINYEKFNQQQSQENQGVSDIVNQQTTSRQPADNQQATTNEEGNKKEKKDKKNIYGEFGNVLLTEEERQGLIKKYGNDLAEKSIVYLDSYIEEKGYKSKSHNLAIQRWVINAVSKDKPKQQQRTGRNSEPEVFEC